MSLAAPGRLWGPRRRAVAVAEPRAGETVAPEDCIGLVTRTLAFAIDGAVINGVAVVVVAVLSLCASIVTLPKELVAVVVAAGGTVYVLWTVGYFVAFWSTTGQTPGDRVMRVRVVTSSGGPLKPRRRCCASARCCWPRSRSARGSSSSSSTTTAGACRTASRGRWSSTPGPSAARRPPPAVRSRDRHAPSGVQVRRREVLVGEPQRPPDRGAARRRRYAEAKVAMKIALMCFSTARLVRNRDCAMASLLLPWAICASVGLGRPEDVERDRVVPVGGPQDVVVQPPALATLMYPLGKGASPCVSSLLARRQLIETIGGFEETFHGIYQLYEDQVFLIKAYLATPVFISSLCCIATASMRLVRVHSEKCRAVSCGAETFPELAQRLPIGPEFTGPTHLEWPQQRAGRVSVSGSNGSTSRVISARSRGPVEEVSEGRRPVSASVFRPVTRPMAWPIGSASSAHVAANRSSAS